MSDQIDQSIIVASEIQTGRHGLKMRARQEYTPPLDGREDLRAEFDLSIAKGIYVLLSKHYFGYEWKSFADSKQGVVGFSIPDLMGPTLHMVVNLKQYSDLNPELIVEKAGELLERMHLPRGQIDMAAYAIARESRHRFDFGDVKQ